MPKASSPLPPRASRKRFYPLEPSEVQGAELLFRFQHGDRTHSSAEFDAALALCRLKRPRCDEPADTQIRNKRRRISEGVPSGLSPGPSSSSSLSSPSSSTSPLLARAGYLKSANPQRFRAIMPGPVPRDPAVASSVSRSETGTPVPVLNKIPTIKISLQSLEKLRKSLDKPPAVYRVIDPAYGSKKRKRV